MKIGLLTGEFPPQHGGIADFTRILATALADRGHAVRVITTLSAQTTQHFSAPYTVHPVARHWGWLDLWRVRQCTADLDIVNLQYQAAAFGAMRLPIHLAPHWLRPPLVATFHDLRTPYLFPKAGALRTAVLRRLASSAAGVIATNIADHAELAGSSKLQRSAVIPIGSNLLQPAACPPAQWRAANSVAADEILLGYFGFLNTSKGGETVLRALALLRQTGMNARVVLIGGSAGASDKTDAAHNQQLLQLAQSLGIDGQILRTGYLSEADTVAALQSCDMLVQPYADGASLRRGTLMACLANGCPTITTNPATRVPELQHNVNVQLVPPNDPAALAAAVRTLQADPALRATLAQGARVLATSFDWASIARRTEEFFSAVLEKHAASAARH